MHPTQTSERGRQPGLQAAGRAWRSLAPGLILFGLVLWTFLPTVRNDFIGFDDPDYVTANDHVQQGLTWSGVRWAFESREAGNWHPVTWLSHMLDCELFGLNPSGHHLTSVLLHSLNAALAFWLFRRLTGAPWRSFLLAALFALHPLRVESVAWASERKDVLSTTFWLLALCAYAAYARARRSQPDRIRRPGAGDGGRLRAALFYSLTLLAFAMGLMSKPMLVTLPFVLLLLDYWPLGRLQSRASIRPLLVEKIPFFLASLAACVVTFEVQRSGGALALNPSTAHRLANAAVSYCRYLGKLIWPVDLAVFYPYPDHWRAGVILFSAVFLAAVSGLAVAQRGRFPSLLVGWLWFLGTLVPVIGLVQAGDQSMADRYSYVPSLGVLLMVLWPVSDLCRHRPRLRATGSLLLAGAAVACICVTRRQIGFWRDSEALFRHAIEATTGNLVAVNNLGVALDQKGKHSEAQGEFAAALTMPAGNHLARNNLGVALDREGRFAEAIEQFRLAIQDKPNYADCYKNLGVVLSEQGRFEEAIQAFESALRYRPRFPEAQDGWGGALEHLGRVDLAIAHYREALRWKPDYGDAHYNLGLALARSGQLDAAIAEFQQAIRCRPNSADACNNLAVALDQAGRLDEAILQYRRAVALKPDYARAHFNLGVALCRTGNLDGGIAEFQEALKLEPGYVPAEKNLATALSLRDAARQPKPASAP